MATTTVHLLPNEIEILTRPANGRGGYQSLIRKLQKKIDTKTGKIDLDDADIVRMKNYRDYGEGTFQSRILEFFSRSLPI